MRERGSVRLLNASHETIASLFYKLFPCGSSEKVLESGDALRPSVAKNLTKKRVISHSQLSTLVSIFHLYDLDGIRQYGHTVGFHKAQHNSVV